MAREEEMWKAVTEEHGELYGWRTSKIDFFKKEIELIENGNTTTQAIIIQ